MTVPITKEKKEIKLNFKISKKKRKNDRKIAEDGNLNSSKTRKPETHYVLARKTRSFAPIKTIIYNIPRSETLNPWVDDRSPLRRRPGAPRRNFLGRPSERMEKMRSFYAQARGDRRSTIDFAIESPLDAPSPWNEETREEERVAALRERRTVREETGDKHENSDDLDRLIMEPTLKIGPGSGSRYCPRTPRVLLQGHRSDIAKLKADLIYIYPHFMHARD